MVQIPGLPATGAEGETDFTLGLQSIGNDVIDANGLGCQSEYSCCGGDEDSDGCEEKHPCCGGREGSLGCQPRYDCCKMPIGDPGCR